MLTRRAGAHQGSSGGDKNSRNAVIRNSLKFEQMNQGKGKGTQRGGKGTKKRRKAIKSAEKGK